MSLPIRARPLRRRAREIFRARNFPRARFLTKFCILKIGFDEIVYPRFFFFFFFLNGKIFFFFYIFFFLIKKATPI